MCIYIFYIVNAFNLVELNIERIIHLVFGPHLPKVLLSKPNHLQRGGMQMKVMKIVDVNIKVNVIVNATTTMMSMNVKDVVERKKADLVIIKMMNI